jgi:hypothetical protein
MNNCTVTRGLAIRMRIDVPMANREQFRVLRYPENVSRNDGPYDLFRRDLLGTPVWMEAVEDLETAKDRMIELAGRSPGEYFVFCQESQEIVSSTPARLFA